MTVGDTFMHKLGKSTVFTQSFLLYPSLTQTNITPAALTADNVYILRGTFNMGLVTKLNKWLGWQLTLSDIL